MKDYFLWFLISAACVILIVMGAVGFQKKPVPMLTPQEFSQSNPTLIPSPLPSPTAVPKEKVEPPGYESHMVSLVNDERARVGVRHLIEVSHIDAGALKRARDIKENGQWSHVGYEIAMRETIKYSGVVLVGENLARDCFDDLQVLGAWLNSPVHKQVMLDSRYNYVGFGSYQGICVLWFSNYK